MELLELKDRVLELFNTDIDHLGDALMQTVNDNDTAMYEQFCELVDNDLSVDWLQMIFQYYHADRSEKMQDYTPKTIADFMGRLVGKADVVVDMCAGSGALTIQRWAHEPGQRMRLIELDRNVIPYLLFNLVIRNIHSDVLMEDVLADSICAHWVVQKGEKYGRVTCL